MTATRPRLLASLLAALVAGTAAAPASADPVVVASAAPPGFECYATPGLIASGPVDTNAIACPGPVPPKCDRSLAAQRTAAGYRCRDRLFKTRCEGTTPRPELEAWCGDIRDRRWAACNRSDNVVTSEFQTWCGSEEERRRQLGESLGNPNDPSPLKPRPQVPTTEPNRPDSSPQDDAVGVDAQLGWDPLCDRSDLPPEMAESCKDHGTIQHDYEFSHYGIDNNVEVDMFNGDFWNGDAPLKSAVQWICVQIWQVLIWLVKMVLSMLSWAFARDPLGMAMGELKTSLTYIHETVLGREWTLAALAVAGMWGIWNGLVRMRVIQTIGGLATTLLLMIGALWMIYDPDASIGFLNRTANEASLSVVSAASTGTFERPGGQFAQGQHGLFERVVEMPWCALQFANVDYCLADRNNDGARNIDVWLSFAPGSASRSALYAATKGEEVPDPRGTLGQVEDWVQMHLSPIPSVREEAEQRRHDETAPQRAADFVEKYPDGVRIQGKDGTFTRLGLLALLAFGMVGAILLFLWLGLRLIGAALISLLLLVLAPVMMLAAAFGEEGRSRFGDWLKALVGAVMAKLIYSLVLALVLLVSRILADLPLDDAATLVVPEPAFAQGTDAVGSGSGNFLGSWLLQSAFWWAVLVRRDRVLGFISFDSVGERDGIGALSRFNFGYSALKSVGHDTRRAVTWGPRKALRLGGRATRHGRNRSDANRAATDATIAATAGEELDQRADTAIRGQREDDLAHATQIMERGRGIEGWLHNVKSDMAQTKDPALRKELEVDKWRLEQELLDHRNDPQTRWAGGVVGRDAAGIKPATAAQRQAWQEQRQKDIATWQANPDSWDSNRNLRAARISPGDLTRAQGRASAGDPAALDALRARSEQTLRRDRDLFARTSEPLDRWTRREAMREYRADLHARRVADNQRGRSERQRERLDRRRVSGRWRT